MKKLVTLLLMMFFYHLSNAQSSVYVCSTNGAYGYCYGTTSAPSCAYNKCLSYGGKTPQMILLVRTKGYGAIAVGRKSDGKKVVGAAAGYKNLADAKRRAIQECSNMGGLNISISNTFNDR